MPIKEIPKHDLYECDICGDTREVKSIQTTPVSGWSIIRTNEKKRFDRFLCVVCTRRLEDTIVGWIAAAKAKR